MKLTRSFLLPVLSLSLALALPAHRAGAASSRMVALLNPWLGPTEAFAPAKLQVLMDLAKRDPRNLAILKAGMARFGATNAAELAKLITVDDPAPKDGTSAANKKGGEFIAGDHRIKVIELAREDWYSESDLSLKEPYRSQIEAFRAENGAYLVYALNQSVRLELHSFSGPSIFIARDGNLGQTFESFLHEMTHFIDFDLRNEPDSLLFDDARSFSDAYLLSPGQEVPARIAGVQALTRLAGDVPYFSSFPVALEDWLTAQGELRKSPADFLGVITSFLGYDVQDLYPNRVEVAASATDSEYRSIQRAGGCEAVAESDPAGAGRCQARMKALIERLQRANALLDRLHAKS